MNCPARQHPEKNCWEIAQEKEDDYRNIFNICQDCIVHVLNSDSSVLSNHEIKKIVDAKTNCRLSRTQPMKCSQANNNVIQSPP